VIAGCRQHLEMAKQVEPYLEHENIVIVVFDVKHFGHDALSKTRGGEPNLLERVEEVDQVVLPLMASPIPVLPRDALTAVCPWLIL
jgi:hypothetical protein